jgi:hypothetical protein
MTHPSISLEEKGKRKGRDREENGKRRGGGEDL